MSERSRASDRSSWSRWIGWIAAVATDAVKPALPVRIHHTELDKKALLVVEVPPGEFLLDRTYLYASNVAIDEGLPRPVHFALGQELTLTDADRLADAAAGGGGVRDFN